MTDNTIESIYFGGGTPSLCSKQEIEKILDTIYNNYSISAKAEITLEANPDDLIQDKIKEIAQTKVNRLSIGVQSFIERDLKLMNRAHNSHEAINCIKLAQKYFKNLSVDLIYGTPGLSDHEWIGNLNKLVDLKIPHISSYALTVEDKTVLKKNIEKGITPKVSDTQSERQYHILVDKLTSNGYINYEFSNFGKPGFYSQNNSAYWQGKVYIGVGPSAHSFNGQARSWNIANNHLYIKNLAQGNRNFETEKLSQSDRFNEYIMTGLRTIWGVSLNKIANEFGTEYLEHLMKASEKPINNQTLKLENEVLHLTAKGKFLGDGISSELFFIN